MSYTKPKDKHVMHTVAVRVCERDYQKLKAKSYETNLSYSDILRLGLKQMLK